MLKALLLYSTTTTCLEGTPMVCRFPVKSIGWNASEPELKVVKQGGLLHNLFWKHPHIFSPKYSVCQKLVFIWFCSLQGCFNLFFSYIWEKIISRKDSPICPDYNRVIGTHTFQYIKKNSLIYITWKKVAKFKSYGSTQSKELCRSIRSTQQALKKKAPNIFQIWHFNLKNMNNWLSEVTQVILSIQMSGTGKHYCTLILWTRISSLFLHGFAFKYKQTTFIKTRCYCLFAPFLLSISCLNDSKYFNKNLTVFAIRSGEVGLRCQIPQVFLQREKKNPDNSHCTLLISLKVFKLLVHSRAKSKQIKTSSSPNKS